MIKCSLIPFSEISLLSTSSLLWILENDAIFPEHVLTKDECNGYKFIQNHENQKRFLSPKKTWILRKKKHFEIFDKSSFRIQLLLTLDVTISVQTCTQVSRADGPTRPPSQSQNHMPCHPGLIISFFPQPKTGTKIQQ